MMGVKTTKEAWLLQTIDKMSRVVRAARCLMGIDRSGLAKVRAELGEALLDLDRFYQLPPPDCRGAAGLARPKKKGGAFAVPNDTTNERNRIAVYQALTDEFRSLLDVMLAARKLRDGAPLTEDTVRNILIGLEYRGAVERQKFGRCHYWRRKNARNQADV